MLSPDRRFATIVLAAGTLVLLIAIAVGQRMGDRVLSQAGADSQNSAVAAVTPEPTQSPGRTAGLEALGDHCRRSRPPLPRSARAPAAIANAIANAQGHPHAGRFADADRDDQSEHPDLAAETDADRYAQ